MTFTLSLQGIRHSQMPVQSKDVPQDGLRRWTPDEYHRLIETGFFDAGRVEMLEGLIWDMAGQTPSHAAGIRLTQTALKGGFASTFEVRTQMPIVLLDGTEPEPDVAIAPGTPFDYLDHHPGPDELLLAVEVSDSTLAKDQGLKLTAYAKAGVVECGIVNLVQRQLEVYRRPSPAGIYTDAAIYQPSQSIAPLKAPDKPVAVADLLPPEPR